MGMRTVRLDDEMERVLKQLTQTTGWSVSTALKQGLLAFDHVARDTQRAPYEILPAFRPRARRIRHRAFNRITPRNRRSTSTKASSMILVDTGPFVTLVRSSRCQTRTMQGILYLSGKAKTGDVTL
jgi:hypothetical protein